MHQSETIVDLKSTKNHRHCINLKITLIKGNVPIIQVEVSHPSNKVLILWFIAVSAAISLNSIHLPQSKSGRNKSFELNIVGSAKGPVTGFT
jgi:hypothetical protein